MLALLAKSVVATLAGALLLLLWWKRPHLSIRDLQKISGERISALPGPTAVKSGDRTVALLIPIRPVDRERLLSIMCVNRAERDAADVEWIRTQMEYHGCIDYARRYAHRLAGVALHEYSVVFSQLPDSRDKRFIQEMVTWVVERN